jgi:hypothetical protein
MGPNLGNYEANYGTRDAANIFSGWNYGGNGLWAPGPENSAIRFNGTSGVRAADASYLDTGTLTAMAWINVDTIGASQFFFNRRDAPAAFSNNSFYLNVTAAGLLAFTYFSGGNARTGSSTATLAARNWYHIAATITAGTQNIYINGLLDSTHTQAGSVNSTAEPLYFGCSHNGGAVGNAFTGSMAWAGYYGKVLTAEQISRIYVAGLDRVRRSRKMTVTAAPTGSWVTSTLKVWVVT